MYQKLFVNSFEMIIIPATIIDMKAAVDIDKPFFWNHLGNNKETYVSMAKKINDIIELLIKSVSIQDIYQKNLFPIPLMRISRQI